MCSMRTLWHLHGRSIPNEYVIACKSRKILHCILRITELLLTYLRDSLSCARKCWYPRYVGFVSCCARKVVLTSQNDFDALNHLTCVTLSRIFLLDHRFPTHVLLTFVDDVCPDQIYHHPARNFCFIMKIFHLLVLIRCPNSEQYSPCAQTPNRMQNVTLSLLGTVPVLDPEPAQVTVRVLSQKFWLCL